MTCCERCIRNKENSVGWYVVKGFGVVGVKRCVQSEDLKKKQQKERKKNREISRRSDNFSCSWKKHV